MSAARPPTDCDSHAAVDSFNGTPKAGFADSMQTPLEMPAGAHAAARRWPRPRKWRGMSLFWRTFLLLALLLVGSAIGWYQLLRTLEYEPRAIDSARQIASLVNLTRAALVHSDAIARVSLIKTLADQEKVRILPREPDDSFEPFHRSHLERRMGAELTALLGEGTVVARRVNDEPGLWVGFAIEGDSYWFLMDRSRVGTRLAGSTWLLWLSVMGALSLLGAALLAGLINKPLKQLSQAAARVGTGDYGDNRLDENALSIEVREVNIGFNRMAGQLRKNEQERTEMLAGISHDLRTPLARLRLEVEMSVADDQARRHMVADIDQVNNVIGKFLDYARPGSLTLLPLPLLQICQSAARPFALRSDMQVGIDMAADLHVLCDEVELARVIANLLENARRYGQTPGSGATRVRMVATAREGWVTLRVRDHGPGVPEAQLALLTRPFFRGDAARSQANGAGLGLAVVAKIVHNMGGQLQFINSPSGGLMALIRLRQASAPAPSPAPAPASASASAGTAASGGAGA